MQRIRSPISPGLRGATTAVAWIKRDDEPGDALFWGSQNGYFVYWRQGQVSMSLSYWSCAHADDLIGRKRLRGNLMPPADRSCGNNWPRIRSRLQPSGNLSSKRRDTGTYTRQCNEAALGLLHLHFRLRRQSHCVR